MPSEEFIKVFAPNEHGIPTKFPWEEICKVLWTKYRTEYAEQLIVVIDKKIYKIECNADAMYYLGRKLRDNALKVSPDQINPDLYIRVNAFTARTIFGGNHHLKLGDTVLGTNGEHSLCPNNLLFKLENISIFTHLAFRLIADGDRAVNHFNIGVYYYSKNPVSASHARSSIVIVHCVLLRLLKEKHEKGVDVFTRYKKICDALAISKCLLTGKLCGKRDTISFVHPIAGLRDAFQNTNNQMYSVVLNYLLQYCRNIGNFDELYRGHAFDGKILSASGLKEMSELDGVKTVDSRVSNHLINFAVSEVRNCKIGYYDDIVAVYPAHDVDGQLLPHVRYRISDLLYALESRRLGDARIDGFFVRDSRLCVLRERPRESRGTTLPHSYNVEQALGFQGNGNYYVGVEIEGGFPNHSVEHSANFANKIRFAKLGMGKGDGSIRVRNSMEIVTPPLSIQNGFYRSRLIDLCSMLAKAGFEQDSSCGVHVHLSTEYASKFQTGFVAKFFADNRNRTFVDLLAGRPSNSYCRRTGVKHKHMLSVYREKTEPGVGPGRYGAVSPNTPHGTTEFRLFGPCFSPIKLLAYVETVLFSLTWAKFADHHDDGENNFGWSYMNYCDWTGATDCARGYLSYINFKKTNVERFPIIQRKILEKLLKKPGIEYPFAIARATATLIHRDLVGSKFHDVAGSAQTGPENENFEELKAAKIVGQKHESGITQFLQAEFAK